MSTPSRKFGLTLFRLIERRFGWIFYKYSPRGVVDYLARIFNNNCRDGYS